MKGTEGLFLRDTPSSSPVAGAAIARKIKEGNP